MKKLWLGILLIVWFCFTIILVGSVIGLLLLMLNDDDTPSSWMTIGINLSKELIR